MGLDLKLNKGGRPRKEIDMDLVERLANIQCTQEEIACVVGCSVDTLVAQPGFSEIYKKGKEVGKSSLRRTQWKLAQTNTAMAIWLGKQYLGQTDKIENVDDQKITIVSDVKKDDGIY